MDNNKLAELLFPNVVNGPEYYEEKYPMRDLKEGAVVTRFAPSPTGFLHFGGLFAAFVGRTAAKATDGVFYLRIEDTDKKREIENGVSLIVKGLNDFGITIDEGMLFDAEGALVSKDGGCMDEPLGYFVNQSTGYIEDEYFGKMFFPVDDKGTFVVVSYHC